MLFLWSHHLYGRNYTGGRVNSRRIVGPTGIFRVSFDGASYTVGAIRADPIAPTVYLFVKLSELRNKNSRQASISFQSDSLILSSRFAISSSSVNFASNFVFFKSAFHSFHFVCEVLITYFKAVESSS